MVADRRVSQDDFELIDGVRAKATGKEGDKIREPADENGQPDFPEGRAAAPVCWVHVRGPSQHNAQHRPAKRCKPGDAKQRLEEAEPRQQRLNGLRMVDLLPDDQHHRKQRAQRQGHPVHTFFRRPAYSQPCYRGTGGPQRNQRQRLPVRQIRRTRDAQQRKRRRLRNLKRPGLLPLVVHGSSPPFGLSGASLQQKSPPFEKRRAKFLTIRTSRG